MGRAGSSRSDHLFERREVPEKMGGVGNGLFAAEEVASQMTVCPMHAMDKSQG